MTIDISRNTFCKGKHYSGVLQQQGKVLLDADWNEEHTIQEHRIETEARDVIGPCGAPKENAGFAFDFFLAKDTLIDLAISPGRIYVDGILCELEEEPTVPIDFIEGSKVIVSKLVVNGRKFEPGQRVEVSSEKGSKKTVIISVDPKDRILALSADVSDLKDGASPKIRRITTYLTQPDYPSPDEGIVSQGPDPLPRLQLDDGDYLIYMDVWKRHITALDDPHIREVALGGPDTTARAKTVWQVKIRRIKSEKEPACDVHLDEWDEITSPSKGMLNARTVKPSEETPCLLPPSAGYQRLENQLYRVEIHKGGRLGEATFKWSRDNGSVVTSIKSISGQTVTVSELEKDKLLGFFKNQWVEITDDETELKGKPGQLATILEIDPHTQEISLSVQPSVDPLKHAKLRRWDQSTASATEEGIITGSEWLPLEGGIEVQFSKEGIYRTGDYWQIPARTATGEIEWPPCQVPNSDPIPQPPLGVRHHFCRLAFLFITNSQDIHEFLKDCRKIFPPLTELSPGEEPGMHIIDVQITGPNGPTSSFSKSLSNNEEVQIEALPKGFELHVICDSKIDLKVVKWHGKPSPIFTITLYLPLKLDHSTLLFSTEEDSVIGYLPFILEADVDLNGDNIIWSPTNKTEEFIKGPLPSNKVLARLDLKGNFIWSEEIPRKYLDGETFGVPPVDMPPGVMPNELVLPSGNGQQGGDFTMWFWIAQKTIG